MTKKKLELKFVNIAIIYATNKQYWGIELNGVKKRLSKEIFDKLKKNKSLISYESSKLFKKNVKFKVISDRIEITVKGVIKVVTVLQNNDVLSAKKKLGQFYTVNSEYIFKGLVIPAKTNKIIEPFAGSGEIIK